jgi:hypothetical protein
MCINLWIVIIKHIVLTQFKMTSSLSSIDKRELIQSTFIMADYEFWSS